MYAKALGTTRLLVVSLWLLGFFPVCAILLAMLCLFGSLRVLSCGLLCVLWCRLRVLDYMLSVVFKVPYAGRF